MGLVDELLKRTPAAREERLLGFAGSLPAPEVSMLQPMAEDALSGEPVEVELMEDDHLPSINGEKSERT